MGKRCPMELVNVEWSAACKYRVSSISGNSFFVFYWLVVWIRTLVKSATWFFLVHVSIHETRRQSLDQRIFGIDLQCTLFSDVFSSSLMVVVSYNIIFSVIPDVSVQQLLKEIPDDRNWNLIPRYMTIRILCKLCWATIQYLEVNILERHPQFEDLIPQFCNSLILLFPVMEMLDGEDNLGMFCSSHSEIGRFA